MNPDDSQTGKRPIDLEATPGTRPAEDSITLPNIYSVVTNQANPGLDEILKSSLADFNLEPIVAGKYELVCSIHDSPRTGVFYARELGTERSVIVKRFSDFDTENFEREKAIQKILKSHGEHKNILLADEFLDEQRAVVSQYMRGGNLRELVKKKRFTLSSAKYLVKGSARAIGYLHQCGVRHRDFKSRNIVLDIADPALEEVTAEALESPTEIVPKVFDYEMSWHPTLGKEDSQTTVGTVYYLAPEALNGEKYDPRSDIYALGVIIYEILTGQYPFKGDQRGEVMEKHLYAPVPKIADYNPNVGVDGQYIVEKAMHKDPEKRYQTADELEQDYMNMLR